MNFSAENLPEWVPEGLRSDPKKLAVLGGLLIVLAVMVGRYLLMTGPATARAASPVSTSAKKAVKSTAAAPTQMSSSATHLWLKQPITSVGRNLFTIRPELFPTVANAEAVAAPVAPGFWDVVEKSRSDQADQKKRRDILVEHLQREAAKLRLQSTVMGPEPQAIIGGTLVKEGSVIASDGPGSTGGGVQFRVLSIEARRVVVERQGIRLEIRMTQ